MTGNLPTTRKSQLLKEFDKSVARVTRVFASHYGEEQTRVLIKEAHQEYEALIPGLPYLGGKQPFTQFIISTAWFLAMYRVLQRRGSTVDEVGRLVYQVGEGLSEERSRLCASLVWAYDILALVLEEVEEASGRVPNAQISWGLCVQLC